MFHKIKFLNSDKSYKIQIFRMILIIYGSYIHHLLYPLNPPEEVGWGSSQLQISAFLRFISPSKNIRAIFSK